MRKWKVERAKFTSLTMNISRISIHLKLFLAKEKKEGRRGREKKSSTKDYIHIRDNNNNNNFFL